MEVSRQDALWRYRLGSAARRRTLPRERFSPLTLTGLHAVLGTGAEYKKTIYARDTALRRERPRCPFHADSYFRLRYFVL
jgi:hypothetical protein